MSFLEQAIALAVEVHKGQVDKANVPYILHPLRVMLQMEQEEEMIVAVLHDVVEDSEYTFEDLRKQGFSENVLAALESVTRRAEESYEDFVQRAGQHPIGRKVKIADLKDNMNPMRLSLLTDHDLKRVKKYHRALRSLTNPTT